MKHTFPICSIAMLGSATVPGQADATQLCGAELNVVLDVSFASGTFWRMNKACS